MLESPSRGVFLVLFVLSKELDKISGKDSEVLHLLNAREEKSHSLQSRFQLT